MPAPGEYTDINCILRRPGSLILPKTSGLPHDSWARERESILSCEEIEACL